MTELTHSLLVGAIFGYLVAWAQLPIPAPATLTGVLGIVGVFLGYSIYHYFVQ